MSDSGPFAPGGPLGRERWTLRVAPPIGILGLVAVAVVAVVLPGGAGSALTGTVYVESNSSAPDSNAILAFKYAHDSLLRTGVARYPTGGSGSHDLSNSGVLDADQEVITNPARTLLFAVNSSSDSIAVFHVRRDGGLVPVAGSPFPSNGSAPSSLGLAGSTLIVANKAQDGVRQLSEVPANYTSFEVHADGTLGRPISSIEIPPGSSPLQAYVTPDRKVMISSEESGVFRAFRIEPGGRLVEGPNSPLPLARPVFAGEPRSLEAWPAGLVSDPHRKLLYAEVANVSRTIVYRWDDDARLAFIRALANRGSFLPCWTETNASGTRVYSGNAGSGNLSVFDTGADPTDPRQIQSVMLHGQGNPWNFQLDPSGRLLFILDMRAISQIPPGQGNQLHLLRIDRRGLLAESPSSPVAIPVPIGTNPIGLAVVPRS